MCPIEIRRISNSLAYRSYPERLIIRRQKARRRIDLFKYIQKLLARSERVNTGVPQKEVKQVTKVANFKAASFYYNDRTEKRKKQILKERRQKDTWRMAKDGDDAEGDNVEPLKPSDNLISDPKQLQRRQKIDARLLAHQWYREHLETKKTQQKLNKI